jgi:hypothetical protein
VGGGNRLVGGAGIYAGLTLSGKHKPVAFDHDDESDPDPDDASGFMNSIFDSIWQDADHAWPPRLFGAASRSDAEIFSQADMGDVSAFRFQTYTPNPKPGDDPNNRPCIGLLLFTSRGPIVLGQWIPPEIAHLHDTKGWHMSEPFSAAHGITFGGRRSLPPHPSAGNGKLYSPLWVRSGKLHDTEAYACAFACNERHSRIIWWTHRDGARVEVRHT